MATLQASMEFIAILCCAIFAGTAPTLIVWGDRDAFCPRGDQDRLQRAITGSRLVIHSGAGHALRWAEPERFATDLLRFANQLPS